MADVRSEAFSALAPQRGLPCNISVGVAKEWENWMGDGHSPSYYTLTELLESKNKSSIVTAYLSVQSYKYYKKMGYPNDWYSYLPFRSKEVSNQEMDKIINLLAFSDGEEYYTETIWEQPNRLICEHFGDKIIPAMQELDSNTDNVRFIFWFDN